MTLAQTAQRLINAKGRTVQLQRVPSTTLDPAKPWRGPATLTDPTPLSIKAVFEDKDENSLLAAMAPATFKRGKTSFMISALDLGAFDIDEGDFLVDDSERWKIVRIQTVKPGTEAILYNLEVQK